VLTCHTFPRVRILKVPRSLRPSSLSAADADATQVHHRSSASSVCSPSPSSRSLSAPLYHASEDFAHLSVARKGRMKWIAKCGYDTVAVHWVDGCRLTSTPAGLMAPMALAAPNAAAAPPMSHFMASMLAPTLRLYPPVSCVICTKERPGGPWVRPAERHAPRM
jgi:hypothetical protein